MNILNAGGGSNEIPASVYLDTDRVSESTIAVRTMPFLWNPSSSARVSDAALHAIVLGFFYEYSKCSSPSPIFLIQVSDEIDSKEILDGKPSGKCLFIFHNRQHVSFSSHLVSELTKGYITHITTPSSYSAPNASRRTLC